MFECTLCYYNRILQTVTYTEGKHISYSSEDGKVKTEESTSGEGLLTI